MHHYPFHPGDYSLATKHWSEARDLVQCEAGLLRDLAYRRLLDLYYGEEEPIPSKTRLVAIRILMLKHEEIVASVLREKFTLKEGFWRQERADEEVQRYQRRAAASRENGRMGGRPKTKDKPTRNQAGTKQVTTRTRTRTIEPPLPPEGVVWWDDFWKTFPRKVAKPDAQRAFAKALTRAPSFQAIMDGLARHLPCDQWKDATKVPHPATWLNRDGWNDEVASAPGADGKSSNWWDTRQGILAEGAKHGLPGPEQESGTPWLRYTASVWLAAGDGPWLDRSATAWGFYQKLRDG